MKTVNLIASGYAWECPECGHPNFVDELPSVVKCEDCDEEFVTNPLHFWKQE